MSESKIPAGFVDVTGIPLENIIRAAYSLSRQQGLGVYDTAGRHAITADVIDEIIKSGENGPQFALISMDYVNGRAVKMTVGKFGERRVIQRRWFDHTDEDMRQFLTLIGIDENALEASADDSNPVD